MKHLLQPVAEATLADGATMPGQLQPPPPMHDGDTLTARHMERMKQRRQQTLARDEARGASRAATSGAQARSTPTPTPAPVHLRGGLAVSPAFCESSDSDLATSEGWTSSALLMPVWHDDADTAEDAWGRGQRC